MNVADSYRNVARNKVCICNDGTWKPLEGKDDETVKDIVALNKDGIQSDNDNDGDALKQRAPNRSLRDLIDRNRANRKKKDAEKAAAAAAAELASKEDVGDAGDDIEEADLFGDD
jgi:phage protein D